MFDSCKFGLNNSKTKDMKAAFRKKMIQHIDYTLSPQTALFIFSDKIAHYSRTWLYSYNYPGNILRLASRRRRIRKFLNRKPLFQMAWSIIMIDFFNMVSIWWTLQVLLIQNWYHWIICCKTHTDTMLINFKYNDMITRSPYIVRSSYYLLLYW